MIKDCHCCKKYILSTEPWFFGYDNIFCSTCCRDNFLNPPETLQLIQIPTAQNHQEPFIVLKFLVFFFLYFYQIK